MIMLIYITVRRESENDSMRPASSLVLHSGFVIDGGRSLL